MTWIYCPGHAGVNGNKIADRLPRKAAVKSTIITDNEEIVRAALNNLPCKGLGWRVRLALREFLSQEKKRDIIHITHNKSVPGTNGTHFDRYWNMGWSTYGSVPNAVTFFLLIKKAHKTWKIHVKAEVRELENFEKRWTPKEDYFIWLLM